MNGAIQAQIGRSIQFDRELSEMNPEMERMWFELDREVVLNQIDSLHSAINENCDQLAMVAHEGVFEKIVSDKLSRAARSLRIMLQQLAGLRGQVAKTNSYRTQSRTKR
jgi:hypothetical protein